MNPTDEKISALVKRHLQIISPEELEKAVERNIQQLNAHPEVIAYKEKRTRSAERRAMAEREPFRLAYRYLILTAVQELGDDAFHYAIADRIEEISGKRPGIFHLDFRISFLQRRGWLGEDNVQDPSGRYGSRQVITEKGELALAYARARQAGSSTWLQDMMRRVTGRED